MLKTIFIACLAWIPGLLIAQVPKTLVVLGSSTSACYGFGGGISDTSCWVNRVTNYYNANGYSITLYNLAVSGYNVYQGMPTGSPPVTISGNTYSPDPVRNITAALALNPDVIIANYPSNVYDVANVNDILLYYRTIFETALAAGKTCFISTTQPRTSFNQTGRNNLIELKDSLLLEYGYYCINFWDLFAEADGSINPLYGQGDGIHLNAMAHDTLRWRTVAKDIFNAGCLNHSISSGNWNDAATWISGVVPGLCDSVVIRAGNTVTLSAAGQARAAYIAPGGTLTLNQPASSLLIGTAGKNNALLRVDGTLQVSDGELLLNGRLQLSSGSNFALTGGLLGIDGNNGDAATSVADGLSLFDVSPSLTSFSFTGGELRLTDPPLGQNSDAISCSYNFGSNSNLVLGDGLSSTASNNSNGFGGLNFPSQIGHLKLDAASTSGNRVFRIVKPLTVTAPLQVESGNLVQAAALSIIN